MSITVKQRTKTIIGILNGDRDETIAKRLKISVPQLKFAYHNGIIPKRKAILNYIIQYHIYHLATLVSDNTISFTTVSSALNNCGVTNQIGREWNSSKVRSYLQQKGIISKKIGKEHCTSKSSLLNLQVTSDDFYRKFGITEEQVTISDYFRTINLDNVEIVVPKNKPHTTFFKTIETGIRQAIDNGAETLSDISKYLNNNGYTNKSGNQIGRWSVKLYMEQLGIDLPLEKRNWGNTDRQFLIAKISEQPKNKVISKEDIDSWINSLDSADEKVMDKGGLYQSVAHLKNRHNQIAKDYVFYNEWFPKMDYAINVVFRHKVATRIDVAEHFGFTAMTAQRYLDRLDYDTELQYYLRFKVLYNGYLDLHKNEDWSSTKCADWFNQSYLRTERDRDWTYTAIQFSIDKLHTLEDKGLL